MTTYVPEYCPYCGEHLPDPNGEGGVCPRCDEVVLKQPVSAAEAIVVDESSVLCIKRAAGRNVGTWGFPGGHVEPGEHPRDAAARELAEETGLTLPAEQLQFLSTLSERNDDGSAYLTHVYAIARGTTSGELTPERGEISSIEFFTPPELDTVPTFRPADVDHAQRAIQLVNED
ncbi:MAG: NUDIX hydrolase [Halobacteriaceae archaeon]